MFIQAGIENKLRSVFREGQAAKGLKEHRERKAVGWVSMRIYHSLTDKRSKVHCKDESNEEELASWTIDEHNLTSTFRIF